MFSNGLAAYRLILLPRKYRVALLLLGRLLAQVCLLASLILPWQLLQILSTGHSRFDDSVAVDGSPIVRLAVYSLLIVACFLAYLWLNRRIEREFERLSNRVIADLGKTKLMANHQTIGTNTMAVIVKSFSAMLNAATFLFFSFLIYPKVAIAVAVYMAVVCSVILKRYQQAKRQQQEIELQQTLQRHLLVVVNGALVVAFLAIVYDYQRGQLPSFFTIFMAVFVLRQAMSAFVNVFVFQLGVIRRQKNIDLLFLPRAQKIAQLQATPFEKRFSVSQLPQWLPAWLNDYAADVLAKPVAGIELVSCRFTNNATIAYVIFRVNYHGDEGGAGEQLLLKCCHPTRHNFYQHEVDFLNAYRQWAQAHSTAESAENPYHIADTPVPKLLLSQQVDWMHGMLFFFPDDIDWRNAAGNKDELHTVRRQLFSMPILPALIKNYEQSHDDLAGRMQQVNWQRLDYFTAQEKESFQLNQLMATWERYIADIRALPKVMSSEILQLRRLVAHDDQPIIYSWQVWLYDTLGTNWLLSPRIADEVESIIDALATQSHPAVSAYIREHGKAQLVQKVMLAARLHHFCRFLNLKDDLSAMKMIATLLML